MRCLRLRLHGSVTPTAVGAERAGALRRPPVPAPQRPSAAMRSQSQAASHYTIFALFDYGQVNRPLRPVFVVELLDKTQHVVVKQKVQR